MRLPKRGERGFTLIELLIVVAILGVLAAVIIPNVQRFIGAGEEEAIDTEFANVQAAVSAMMVDNQLPTLPTPVPAPPATDATNDMGAFPDISLIGADLKEYDVTGELYVSPGDQDGYYLYQHDRIAGDTSMVLINYVAQRYTEYYYTVDANGTITQYINAGKTEQLNPPPPPE